MSGIFYPSEEKIQDCVYCKSKITLELSHGDERDGYLMQARIRCKKCNFQVKTKGAQTKKSYPYCDNSNVIGDAIAKWNNRNQRKTKTDTDEVVMPTLGDAIFVRNHEDLGYEIYVFDKFENMNVLCLDGGCSWDLWRLNLSDPWRDASGKIVEV